MVIIKPFKVLVCLAAVALFTIAETGWGSNGTVVPGPPGVEADALSADTGRRTIQPAQPLRKQAPRTGYQSGKEATRSSKTITITSRTSNPGRVSRPVPYDPGWASAPVPYNPGYPGAPLACPPGVEACPTGPEVCAPAPPACPPAPPPCDMGVCQAPQLCSPGISDFASPWLSLLPPLPDLGLRPLSSNAYLPRPGCKQFQLVARLWYAKLNSTTVLWGTNLAAPAGPGTELDLHRDLGLNKQFYVPEYEGRFQIRPNWGLRFLFMPIQLDQTTYITTPGGFFWGNNFYPQYAQMYTQWHRYKYSWDIVYDWFQARHAVSSIFAGYTLYDDKLSVSSPSASRFPSLRSRSRGWGLAFAGMSLDKIVRDFGCNGSTASVHCKFTLTFLEGYFGWDGAAMGRVTVPMNCGRYGYIEGGWRWIVLQRDQPIDKDKTSMDGLQVAAGIIF